MPKKLTPPGTPPNAAPKQMTDEERIARAEAKRERKKKKKARDINRTEVNDD